MNILGYLKTGWVNRGADDKEILAAFDPWILACAVGASNGTVGINIGFDDWLRQSKKNWLGRMKVSASEREIVRVLRQFVEENCNSDMTQLFYAIRRERGLTVPNEIEPQSQSIVVRMQL